MSSLRAAAGWLRRKIAWSNSRRSWYERLGLLALIVTAAGAEWLSRDWGVEARLLLMALWLVFFAVLLRRGIIKLLGPVFFFELLRGSRKRIHLSRTIYGLILLFALGYVYLAYHEFDRGYGQQTLQQQAEIASTFFAVFFAIQMVVVVFITPVMMAGTIAEEEERRTLEFILATDLRSREIVLGKLAARMTGMTFLMLAGLPILSLLQIEGGIDPGLLLCAGAALGLTLMGIAAVSLWMSAMLRRGRDAIVMTYLAIGGYCLVSGCARLLLLSTAFTLGGVTLAGYSATGQDLVDVFGAGNPFIVAATIGKELSNENGSVMNVVPELLKEYAIFHGLVGLVALVWSVARLRPVAIAQSSGGDTKRRRRGRQLPALGRFPMIWKELFAEPGMRLHLLLYLLLAIIVLASFVPPVMITGAYLDELIARRQPDRFGGYNDPWRYYGEAMNAWVRGMGGVVGTLLLIMVAARAAGAVSGERGRKTLDELLTSPLTNAEIVNAKWLGAVFGTRRVWIWLGAVFFIGLCTGGLIPVGVILYAVAWFCYAGFMASLGLWFSTVCRTTFRATMATVLTSLLVLGGHWALSGLFCYLPLAMAFDRYLNRDLVDWMVALQLGVTPPFGLGMAAFHSFDEFERIHEDDIKLIVCPTLGLPAFFVAGQLLRGAVIRRFGLVMGWTAVRKPEGAPRKQPEALPVLEPAPSASR